MNQLGDALRVLATLLACAGMPASVLGKAKPFVPVTDEVLENPDPADWLM